ncbi:MAG: tRNA uridine-5-carboxymethylaminomethyl(34) synthesis GTPase MnmE [Gammaproteobacteria bacterium]
MYVRDTIAALSTAPGRGAIGVVRVSGPAAPALAARICGRAPTPRHAHYRPFTDDADRPSDRGSVLFFPAPASYTGEDLVEFQLHGSPPLLRELLATLYRLGARAARPGEFTARAFLNERIDLLQAEAVASLIDSASLQAARAARNACDGAFSTAVDALAAALRRLRVQIEALIDFGDDVPGDETETHVAAQLDALAADVDRVLTDARRGARLAQGVDIAIVGRPNSGKSTLLNRLCGEERAIVTDVPGTTRDVLSVDLELDGLAVRLHDTAGLRDSDDVVERAGVVRARQRLTRCDLALHLVAPDVDDGGLAEELAALGVPVLTVATKCDLAAPTAVATVAVSAHTGAGLDALRTAILAHSGGLEAIDAPYVARARHLRALEEVAADIAAARRACAAGQLELAADDLLQSLHALEEMTGVYTTEDLLGDIFSSFCIGK